MCSDIRKEYDGKKLIAYCVKHGATVRWGKGDHAVVQYKNQHEVIPARPVPGERKEQK